ncbi:MAG: hypothetical protein AB3N18_15705 [Allomuricauda sp.]
MDNNFDKIKHILHNKQRSFLKNLAMELNITHRKNIPTEELISKINVKENEKYLLDLLEIRKRTNYSVWLRNFFALCTFILAIIKYQDGIKINSFINQIESLEQKLQETVKNSEQKQFESIFLLSNKYQKIKTKYDLGYMVFGVKKNNQAVLGNFNFKDSFISRFEIEKVEVFKVGSPGSYHFHFNNVSFINDYYSIEGDNWLAIFENAKVGSIHKIYDGSEYNISVEYIDFLNERPIFLIGFNKV